MAHERAGHTLQPTALVNEAYLRLVGNSARLEDRAHFFGAAALAMERVLIDHARSRNAAKRGGSERAITLADVSDASDAPDIDLIALRDAIAELHSQHEELARIIRFRYYLGLTLEEISELLPMPLRTLKRRWAFARAWLQERLTDASQS
jgi:RNA polymerase sigma factor (TIGR02999 family)